MGLFGNNQKNNTNVKNSVSGLRIYYDRHNRPVYYQKSKKCAYILEDSEKTYQTLSMRYVIAIVAAVLSYSMDLGYLISGVIGVGVALVMEVRFRSFLKQLPRIENFQPDKKAGFWDGLMGQETNKLVMKAVLWIAFGICLVINAYDKNFTGFVLYINYAISVFAIVIAILHISACTMKSSKQGS